MNRRNLFKMLGAAVASVVCAPLAKLLPRKPVNMYVEAAPRLTVNQPSPLLAFTRKEYALCEEDWYAVYTRAFAEGRIRIIEPDGTVKLLRA